MSTPSVISLLFVILVIGCKARDDSAANGSMPESQASASKLIRATSDDSAALEREKCRRNFERITKETEHLLKQTQFWEAKLALADCPSVLSDEFYQIEAKVKLLARQTAENQKASRDERLRAIRYLQIESPVEGAKFENTLKQLQGYYDRQYETWLKASRRKQGLTLGMTAEDVMKSSWGRPRSVNRTITRSGTHEQWVYDSGYLYFEGGMLSAIQN